MKKLTMLAAIIGTVGSLAIADASVAPAAAQDRFAFSFSVGDVDMAYRNGYTDRYGRFHYWSSPREMREFRGRYASRYRDSDWDGIPNRYDRDRDGDGVPTASTETRTVLTMAPTALAATGMATACPNRSTISPPPVS